MINNHGDIEQGLGNVIFQKNQIWKQFFATPQQAKTAICICVLIKSICSDKEYFLALYVAQGPVTIKFVNTFFITYC